MVDEAAKNLQAGSDKLKQLEKECHKALAKKRQLDSQLSENKAVKEELDLLKPNNEVFKLIGPVLVKQDQDEAKQNVEKRMEYISSELSRTDEMLTKLEKDHAGQCAEIQKLQEVYNKAMKAK